MNDLIVVELGTTAEEMGQRFIEAWQAADRGEARACHRRLVFETAESLIECAKSTGDGQLSGLEDAEMQAARRAAADL